MSPLQLPSLDSQFWHRPDRSQVKVPAGRREEATAGPKPVPGMLRWKHAEGVRSEEVREVGLRSVLQARMPLLSSMS